MVVDRDWRREKWGSISQRCIISVMQYEKVLESYCVVFIAVIMYCVFKNLLRE